MDGAAVRESNRAKVNLTLDVLRKRPADGYHDIQSVMVPVSLCDELTMIHADGLTVTADPEIPGPPEHNLAYRAARVLRDQLGFRAGAHIHIRKRIPVAGGLAGGSGNAAAALRGLNRLWGGGLSDADLASIGAKLGSDVPFCLLERPALVEGVGERLSPVCVASPFWAVVAYPAVPKSTGRVYGWLDELTAYPRPDLKRMLQALAAGDLVEIAGALGNVFEEVMLPRHPEIGRLKEVMLAGGALGAIMSGAGPSVFGLVTDEPAGQRLTARMVHQGGATAAFVVCVEPTAPGLSPCV